MGGGADSRCGFVCLVGRPNVGKSTLLNRLVGQKLSITSKRPQTTRHRVLGIRTDGPTQMIYVDTPGMHQREQRAVNRYMNRAAGDALRDVDVVVLVVDAAQWTEDDDLVVERLARVDAPVILAINKVDRLKDKSRLLPVLDEYAGKRDFREVIPVSALKGDNVDTLERLIRDLLPESPHYFPPDQVTDRSERFLAAELVREKLFRGLGEELPYGVTVEIERFKDDDGLLRIQGLIWVDKESHKPMVIGKGGARLKEIGRQARIDMERLFGSKVFLELWVKVKEGWADDERALRSLGYTDE